MTNETIRKENRKLGFDTIFFNEENGVISYTEKGMIYLNTAYNNLYLANKRETLHLFENHPYFDLVKIACLKKLPFSEYEKLYGFYLDKYKNLYSEEDIENGVIDNEIVIDIIVGNGHFSNALNNFVRGFYDEIICSVQKWAKGTRYTTYLAGSELDYENEA